VPLKPTLAKGVIYDRQEADKGRASKGRLSAGKLRVIIETPDAKTMKAVKEDAALATKEMILTIFANGIGLIPSPAVALPRGADG
jgi:hypothetical protein